MLLCVYANSEHFLFLLTDVDPMWSSAAGAHLLQGLTCCAFRNATLQSLVTVVISVTAVSLWNSLTSFALIICKPLVSTLVINEVRIRLLSSKYSMQSDFFCIQRSHPLLVNSNKAGSVLLHWLHYSHPYKQSMAKTLFSKWWAHSGNTYKKKTRQGRRWILWENRRRALVYIKRNRGEGPSWKHEMRSSIHAVCLSCCSKCVNAHTQTHTYCILPGISLYLSNCGAKRISFSWPHDWLQMLRFTVCVCLSAWRRE